MDLKVVRFLGFGCRLGQLCAPRHRFFVSCADVVDPKVEVDLLRVPMRPLGRTVIRRELDPTRGSPSTTTMCQSSSASIVPPRSPAQKLLSAARSAASKTTT